MSNFDKVEIETDQNVAGWSDALLPEECADSFDPKFILARAVRSEVVTRLKVERAARFGDDPLPLFGQEHRAEFLDAMLSNDREAFDATVTRMDLRDKPFTETLRQLISPTLDDLGQMWRDDRASFMDVTLATCRVQTFMCEKLGATAKRDRSGETHGSIAFARPAGESHTLGLTVVTECFRIDGWNVMGGVDLEIGDGLWSLLRDRHVDVLGITVGSVMQVASVAEAVKKAKQLSCNPDLVIGLGGYCAISDPDAMEGLGADFISADALDAVDTAASFLGENSAQA